MTTEIHNKLSCGGRRAALATVPQRTKGYKPTPEAVAKRAASLRGHSCSEETREKIKLAHQGRKLSEDHRRKLSISHKGKPWSEVQRLAGGKPWSEERRRNHRPVYGHKMSAANKAALMKSRIGSKHTDAAKLKMSMKLKGRKISDAAKKAISETMKAKFASQHASIVRPYRTPWRRQPEYLDKQGRIWKLRSQWELSFAQYLDSKALNWTYEPYFLLLSNGLRYKPDFWVQEWNVYVEIKGWRGWGSTNKAHLAQRDGHPMLFLDSKAWENPSWVPPCKEEQNVHMDQ